MAGQYEGFTLGFRAQDAALKESEKALGAVNAQLVKVRENAAKMRISPEFPKEINHINTVTASYIQRLEAEGRTYKANQEKVKAYRSALSELTAKQKDLESGLSRIKEKSGVASSAYRAQKIQINQTAASVTKLQRTINELHPTGFDRVTTKIKKAEAASQSLKSTLKSGWDSIKGGTMAAAIGVGAIGAAAVSGAKQAGNLEQRYKEITNLATLGGEKQREVTKAVAQMQASGRDMAIKYGKSQQAIAAGYEDLIKRGYSTKQALGAMRTEVQASIASGDKFSDVTTVSSQVLESFGMRAKGTTAMVRNTKKAVNELAYSADMTSTGFQSLGIGMSYVGAAAHSAHISLAETASAMGVLSNNGLEADKAGTGLRNVINNIVSQTNKIGQKNSIFSKLGITKSEIMNSKGQIRSLSDAMSVIYKHIKEKSKNSVEEQGFFKSIFGTTGQQAGIILAKNTGQLDELAKKTAKAGKQGNYVAQLAAKNGQTAQMQMAKAQQAAQAFKMELGAQLLPAINETGNELAKFLTTKDGKQFEKNVAGTVRNLGDALVNTIRFTEQHPLALKAIGGGFLAGYTAVKMAHVISFLGDLKDNYSKLAETSPKLKDLGSATQKLVKPTKFSDLSKGGKLAVGVAAYFDAVQVTSSLRKAIYSKNSQTKIQGYGQAAGEVIGAGIGYSLGGIVGGQIGAELGRAMGPKAAKAFVSAFHPNIEYKLKKPEHSGKRKILDYDENGYHYRVGNSSKIYYQDQRNSSEKQLNTGHILSIPGFTHPKNPIDFLASVVSGGWQLGSHAFDLSYMKRSARFVNADAKGTWLDPFSWFPLHVQKPKTKSGKRAQVGWDHYLKTGDTSKIKGAKLYASGILPKVNAKKWSKNIVKDIQGNFNSFKSWTGKLGKESSKKMQAGWSGMKSWSKKTSRNVQSGWNGFKSWTGKLGRESSKKMKSGWYGMKSWASGVNKHIQAGWNGSTKWFSGLGRGMVKAVKSPWNGVTNFFSGIWNNIKGIVDKVLSAGDKVKGFIGKGVNTVASSAKGMWHKITGHASGGYISSGHGALVGEAGPELAYKAGSNARLLGANGPEITEVHAGEHILNARDTQKVMSGGLGQGLILKGYANGNTTVKKTKNNLNTIKKNTSDTWKSVVRDTKRQTKQNSRNTTNAFTDMRKGVHKQMTTLKSGTIDLAKSTSKGFGKAMGKMKDYARSAMSGTVDEINRGIRGIDKVLGQFGGNASVIKPVHFAAGTDSNGRLTKNTYAMVNDATSGPRQEALISDKNEVYMPRGDNLTMMIPKGWGVLNGTQVQQAGLTHFAKGSGVSHKLLEKIASNALKDPAKSFRNMYSSNLHEGGTDIKKGTIGLAQRASTRYGDPWSNAMWTVINNAIDDGDGGPASGLLAAVEKYGEGHRYVWGATGPTTFDCSGLVMYALNKKYGIKYPHFSGSQYSMTEHISKANAKMGDLVFWGAGGSEHVGVYAGHNKYFSAQSPSQGIHMNTLSSVVGKGAPLFGRVKGLSQGHETKKHTADKRLIALAKQELGSRAIKWIKDNLGDGGSYANPAGDGVARWRPLVKKALRANGFGATPSQVNAWMRVIARESGGNPRAVNNWDSNAAAGIPSKGLVQTIEPTFNAYAKRGHHNIFNGYDNLLAGINYMAHKYGRGASAFARVSGPEGYAKGGDPKVGDTVLVGENGPELAQFKHPVHVYSNSQSHNLLSSLSKKKIPTRKTINPTINININGNISSVAEANRVSDIIARKIEQVLDEIADNWGTELDAY